MLNATPAILASINYVGAGQTRATNVVVDSDNNAQLVTLTAGTYSVSSSGTGPIVLTGTVQRTNTANNSSARMDLTLGGTNEGNNTLSGNISQPGSNSATLGIKKVGISRWVLSGNNSHTGQTDITAGTLAAQSATALGGTAGTFIIRDGATLELSGGYTFNKSDADWELRNPSGGINSIGSNTIRCRNFALIEATTTFTVTTGNKLTIDPQLSGGTEGVISGTDKALTKAGDGELELAANANTFTGAVTVSAGTLTVGSVGNATPSPIAAAWGQAASAVLVSGTLKYNGGEGSTNRAVQMTGSAPTIDASGSGALTLSNVTQDTTAKTMTLRGSSTEANTVSNAIANNTGAVSLAKEDAGKWVLSGALTYTGTTAVNGGTLRVETGNSNTTTSVVTIGASGTVELVTNTLASTGATSGEVLGTGNVTCNGTIKTRGGNTQKGQVRYGGNLTFGAGSSLYIGAAA
jgi:fibronectin-binding autotransporter adhesin